MLTCQLDSTWSNREIIRREKKGSLSRSFFFGNLGVRIVFCGVVWINSITIIKRLRQLLFTIATVDNCKQLSTIVDNWWQLSTVADSCWQLVFYVPNLLFFKLFCGFSFWTVRRPSYIAPKYFFFLRWKCTCFTIFLYQKLGKNVHFHHVKYETTPDMSHIQTTIVI